MRLIDFWKDVWIVLVVYRQSVKDCQAYLSLAESAKRSGLSFNIFVYDNSPSLSADLPAGIFYEHNPVNAGVSRGYNRAFALAKEQKGKFLLLLDQDCRISPEFVNAYYEAWLACPQIHVFAPVVRDSSRKYSPFRFRFGKGYAPSSLTPGKYFLDDYYIINAGLLITTQAFEESGGYDERFPLDLSDVAFCMRLRKAGYPFVLMNFILEHEHSSTSMDNAQASARFDSHLRSVRTFGAVFQSRVIWVGAVSNAIKLAFRHGKISYIQRLLRGVE